MAHLTTTRAVITKLGGVGPVAEMTKRTYNAAWNWLAFKTFPADTYVEMTEALDKAGHTAPASLWRQSAGRRRKQRSKQPEAVA